MKPDDVCKKYGPRPIKLRVHDLGELILVEGTREALEFLGELLLAQVWQRMMDLRLVRGDRANTSSIRVLKRAFTSAESMNETHHAAGTVNEAAGAV